MRLKREWGDDMGEEEVSASVGSPTCPVCSANFSFHSQLRRHVRYKHPQFDTRELDGVCTQSLQCAATGQTQDELMETIETEGDNGVSDGMPDQLNFNCSWCDLEKDEKEGYDQHIEDHKTEAYKEYLKAVDILLKKKTGKDKHYPQVQEQNLKPVDMIDKNKTCSSSSNVVKDEQNVNSMKNVSSVSDEITIGVSESRCSVQQTDDSVGKISNSYTCCGTVYPSRISFENHMTTSHRDSVRHCVLCDEVCQNTESYQCHIVHHYRGAMTCPVCPIKFSLRSHLVSHLNCCHSSGYIIVCEHCTSEFTDYSDYEIHVAHEHGHGAFVKCKICCKEILAFNFNEHLKLHEDSPSTGSLARPHSCPICSAKFIFSTQLYHHKYREHKDAFIYNCDECERRFRSERTLSRHKWGHRYGSHQCPACRLKFRQVDQLKRHLLSVHPEQEGYKCKFCSTILKNYSTYVAHLKFKHPKEAGYDKRPVRCKVCGESFDHKVQWKYHMRTHNSSLQTCSVCGVHVKNLGIHMNLHTKEKKFECSDCGAVYLNKASFHFHVKRVHMGETVRKHECEICRKSFVTPADLRIHKSHVHRGERNYWCAICCKGYKNKASLTYHQRLHTGERPHQCTICKRSFRIPSYLKRHMEHDHQVSYPGVYFKKGRPQSQDKRKNAHRYNRQLHISENPAAAAAAATGEEINTTLPEIVHITVPTEVGGEVVSAVQSAQDFGQEQQHLQLEHFEQEGVVYVVYEN